MKLLLPIPGICFLFRLRVSFYPCSRLFLFFRLRISFYPRSRLFLFFRLRISHSLRLCLLSKICPRHLKHRPHTHTDCSPVKRIAAPCGQQHRIHSKRRSRAENSAHVRRIYHIFQNCNSFCPLADTLHRRERLPVHRTEHSSGQLKTCQLREYIKLRRVGRDLPAPCKNLLSFSLNMPFFRQN